MTNLNSWNYQESFASDGVNKSQYHPRSHSTAVADVTVEKSQDYYQRYSQPQQQQQQQIWPSKPIKNDVNFYSSFVDVSHHGHDTRKFSWHPSKSSQQDAARSKIYSVQQRPFESSFKTAINKMKETSLSRLGNVEKSKTTLQNSSGAAQTDVGRSLTDADNQYKSIQVGRSNLYSTSEPVTYRSQGQTKKFRCNSTSSHTITDSNDTSGLYKMIIPVKPHPQGERKQQQQQQIKMVQSTHWNDVNSSKTVHSDQYSATGSDDVIDNKVPFKTQSLDRKQNINYPKKGTQILIPIQGRPREPECVTSNVKESFNEPIVKPTKVERVQSSMPTNLIKASSKSEDDEADEEPLPSVQDIIAKVEALNQWDLQTKPPVAKLNKSATMPAPVQPVLYNKYNALHKRSASYNKPDSTPLVATTQSTNQSSKILSGMYKKGPNTSPKGKSIMDLPSDFQKLHSAFLDQKKEILYLRKELELKKDLIKRLESNLRNYEPWR